MKASAVRPITDLKNKTKEVVREVTEGQPVVITQNGKPTVVLMDVHQHDRLQDTLAMLKLLAQSQESLEKEPTHSTADVRRRARAALLKAARK